MGLRQGEYDRQVHTLADHVVTDPVGFLRCGNLLAVEHVVEAESGKVNNAVLWTYLRKKD